MRTARGLFITGTDTGVGKTFVTAFIARALRREGRDVGVYKPVASGCTVVDGKLVSEDALALWEAADQPGDVERVCPQRFAAPLAPPLAARAEGRAIDERLLVDGLRYWLQRSEIVLVEGAGGLLCPVTNERYVGDLAEEFGFPLVIVARNALGTINHTLATSLVAEAHFPRLPIAGIVVNQTQAEPDESAATNIGEIQRRCHPPLLAVIDHDGASTSSVDWYELACGGDCRIA